METGVAKGVDFGRGKIVIDRDLRGQDRSLEPNRITDIGRADGGRLKSKEVVLVRQ